MDAERLTDIVHRALGRAAIATGSWCDAYRPDAADFPLKTENRFMRLQATFTSPSGFDRPVGYSQGAWNGLFDAAYTKPGDYLVQRSGHERDSEDGIWFVAAQEPLLPVLCVRANRKLSVSRPAAPIAPGANAYGGVTSTNRLPLAAHWPASILASGGSGLDGGALPADAGAPSVTILLPRIPGVIIELGDLVTDDLGRTSAVASAELTALGWRLLAKIATF